MNTSAFNYTGSTVPVTDSYFVKPKPIYCIKKTELATEKNNLEQIAHFLSLVSTSMFMSLIHLRAQNFVGAQNICRMKE